MLSVFTAALVSALMLVMLACGDSQPLPDIDATVEARVEVAMAPLADIKRLRISNTKVCRGVIVTVIVVV